MKKSVKLKAASKPNVRNANIGSARFEDWPTRLFALIEERRHTPFAWGRQDCCLFACDGILAQTGLDPAAKLYRGKYRDALGAARLLQRHGGVEAIATNICGRLGYAPIPVLFAQRGDVVAIDRVDPAWPGAGFALGLCLGAEAAFPGGAGLVFHPVARCTRAWAVGRAAPLRAAAVPGFVPGSAPASLAALRAVGPGGRKPGQRRVG